MTEEEVEVVEEGEEKMEEVVTVDDGNVDRLEMRVKARPFDFSAHQELIEELRKKSSKIPNYRERMHAACDLFASIWPLPEEIWIEILQDEISNLDLSNETQRLQAESLCKRALSDYLSIDLWVLFCDIVKQQQPTSKEAEEEEEETKNNLIRKTFEDAIIAGGLHAVEGSKIWSAYRDFESSVGSGGGVLSEEEQKKKKERIEKLFQRQLSIPLSGMEATLEEFEEWAESNHVEEAVRETARDNYEKAHSQLLKLVQFEREIMNSGTTTSPDYSKLQAWKDYISYEQANSTSNPQRVICLFERAVKIFALLPDLWISYIGFIEKTFGSSNDLTLNLYSRSERNVPSCGKIWAGHIRAFERANKSEIDIENLVSKAKEMLSDNVENLVEVLHAHIDWFRRFVCNNQNNNKDIEKLRKICSDDTELIHSKFPKKGFNSELLQQWGRFEYRLFKNPTKGHELWERAMRSKSNDVLSWLEFIQLERSIGSIEKCRSLFKRACQSVTDNLEMIIRSWIQFEREEGTIEQWQQAWDRGIQRLQTIQFNGSISSTSITTSTTFNPQENENAKQQEKKKKKTKKELVRNREDEDANVGKTDEPVPKKRPNTGVDLSATTTVLEPKRLEERNAKTVYVSGIAFDVVEDDLMEIFSKFGEIIAVRLGRNKQTGKSRGFAFIEFQTDSSADSALGADKIEIHGKKISVVKSGNQQQQQGHQDDALSLFVSNLPFKATEQDLNILFSQCGEIQNLYVARDSSGKSKGYATIQFANEESVNAGLALDKHMLMNRPLKVQHYNSSIRNNPQSSSSSSNVPSVITEQQQQQTESREKVTFAIPRSLRKPK